MIPFFTNYRSTGKQRSELVAGFRETGHVLLTTYSSLRLNQDLLLPIKWDYGTD